jgi:hypothetical protein
MTMTVGVTAIALELLSNGFEDRIRGSRRLLTIMGLSLIQFNTDKRCFLDFSHEMKLCT